MLKQILDYSEYNQPPYLAGQFQGSNFIGLLEAFDKQADGLDSAAFALITDMWIETAVGEQLDICGKHVDISRGGRADEEYRRALQTKVVANVGSGTPEVIIEVAKVLFAADLITLTPTFPGKIYLAEDGESHALLYALAGVRSTTETNLLGVDDGTGVSQLQFVTEDSVVLDLLLKIVPAGVRLFLLQYLGFADGTYFGLDGGDYLAVLLNNG